MRNVTSEAKAFSISWETLRYWCERNVLSVLFVVMCLVLGVFLPVFLTAENWVLILQSSAIMGIMAIGLAFVMISGGFDLSFAATMIVSSAISARILVGDDPNSAWAIFAAPAVGLLIGLANGAVVVLSGISPLLGTIANSLIIRGVGVLTVIGAWMEIPHAATGFLFIGQGSIAGVPFPIYIFLAIALVAHIVLTRTSFGRQLFSCGANSQAAYLAGLPVRRVQITAYGICGMCAGVAGMINISSIGGLSAMFNVGYLYDVITAVVIGGVSFYGGIGSIGTVMIGILLLGILKNAMVIMNMPLYVQNATSGVFLLIAIGIDSYLQKRRSR